MCMLPYNKINELFEQSATKYIEQKSLKRTNQVAGSFVLPFKDINLNVPRLPKFNALINRPIYNNWKENAKNPFTFSGEFGLHLNTKFHEFYARNNRGNSKKNLRCFPSCTDDGHSPSFFCGNTINATIEVPQNFPQEMMNRVIILGEIRPTDFNTVHPTWLRKNDKVLSHEIANDINDTTFSRYQGEIHVMKSLINVKFDKSPWGYQWLANRWRESKHTFEISILVPTYVDSSTELTVVSQFTGPEFQIGCTRRVNCIEAVAQKTVLKRRKRGTSSKAVRHSKPLKLKPEVKVKVEFFNVIKTKENKDSDSDSDSEDEPISRKPNTRLLTKTKLSTSRSSKAYPSLNMATATTSSSSSSKTYPSLNMALDSCHLYETNQKIQQVQQVTEEIISTDESAALLTDACIMSEENAAILTDETAASLDISPDIFILAAQKMMESVREREEQQQQQQLPFQFVDNEQDNFENLFESAQILLSGPIVKKKNKKSKQIYGDEFSNYVPTSRSPRSLIKI